MYTHIHAKYIHINMCQWVTCKNLIGQNCVMCCNKKLVRKKINFIWEQNFFSIGEEKGGHNWVGNMQYISNVTECRYAFFIYRIL